MHIYDTCVYVHIYKIYIYALSDFDIYLQPQYMYFSEIFDDEL